MKIEPSLRLYGMKLKDSNIYKDEGYYKILSDTYGYASLKLSIAFRNLFRSIIKTVS